MLTGEEPEPEARPPPVPAVVARTGSDSESATAEAQVHSETRCGTVWTDARMRGLRSSAGGAQRVTKPHSDECRARMDELMQRDKGALVQQRLHTDRLSRGSTVAGSSGDDRRNPDAEAAWIRPARREQPRYTSSRVAVEHRTEGADEPMGTAGQKMWGEHLRSSGFELGTSNPALYRSELVSGFSHGDDFVAAATEDQIEIFGKLLHEKFDTRCIGMIGAAEHLDKEMEVLHRTVRVINSELMEMEADQKHVPQLLKDHGLTQSNIVKTPRRKFECK